MGQWKSPRVAEPDACALAADWADEAVSRLLNPINASLRRMGQLGRVAGVAEPDVIFPLPSDQRLMQFEIE